MAEGGANFLAPPFEQAAQNGGANGEGGAKPPKGDAKPLEGGAKALLAGLFGVANRIYGNAKVSATLKGELIYLRLRAYDKETGKWQYLGYLGALTPKREGTKRISEQDITNYEQRKKRNPRRSKETD